MRIWSVEVFTNLKYFSFFVKKERLYIFDSTKSKKFETISALNFNESYERFKGIRIQSGMYRHLYGTFRFLCCIFICNRQLKYIMEKRNKNSLLLNFTVKFSSWILLFMYERYMFDRTLTFLLKSPISFLTRSVIFLVISI